MEFSNKLKEFSTRISKMKDTVQTEEATKTSLIMPFFNLLGYDVFNPAEFCPEFIADVGIKRGEKVDYAILQDGKPLILVECKSCTDTLERHGSQLFRYFGTTSARFGILTNGIIYKFFTDLEETNKMDLLPFLEINLLDIKDAYINEIRKFCKDQFDSDRVFSTASELKYSGLIKDYLAKELENPSDAFVKHILSYIYDGQRTQKIIDKYQPLVKKAFTSFINDIVNRKISSALTPEPEDLPVNNAETPAEVSVKSKVVTTEEELQSFYIIKSIMAGVTDISNITHRDTESYFGVLFQDNNRKPVCRVNFDRKQKQIMIPDEKKVFTRYYLEQIDDIYKYKDQLIAVVKRYL